MAPVLHSPELAITELASVNDPAFVGLDDAERKAYHAGDLSRWLRWTPAGTPVRVSVRPLTMAEEDRVGIHARAVASSHSDADSWRVAYSYARAVEAFRLGAISAIRGDGETAQRWDKAAMLRWPLEMRREIGSLILTMTEPSDPFSGA